MKQRVHGTKTFNTPQEKMMNQAMERIDAIYMEGFTAENLVALLRIANYAARQAASLSNAMLVQGDENEQRKDESPKTTSEELPERWTRKRIERLCKAARFMSNEYSNLLGWAELTNALNALEGKAYDKDDDR